MKKILLIASALMFTLSGLFAQTESVKKFYDRYTNQEKVSDYTINGWLLKVASEYSDNADAGKVLEKITQLRVLVMDDGNPISSHEYKDFMKVLRKDNFEELIKIKDKDVDVDFFIREEAEHITNVLMLVNEKDGFVLISLEGLLKMEDLKNINLDIEGGKHFEAMGKKIPRA